ncbi:Myb-like DNA-binding protein [Nitzschia inconspicua]|uniref:Myb-like DNA-binding protein n=1 Tax=Nitzschia inconspicua TaxID=303405 RepID=A0A9K3KAK7_9STRA|nr:Myb-like DNA-binding protein [Nitzschia inconspicua]KAG7364052.1 Myb-like DNA-binding protein [Nitzschia inconspicua]
MTTRPSPLSVKDDNVHDLSPRRSTRVSSRKCVDNSNKSSAFSKTHAAMVPFTAIPTTRTRGGRANRKRRVTLSPSSSPSYNKMKVASKHETPCISIKVTMDTSMSPPNRRLSTDLPAKTLSKRTKIGRWEKWEQIAFLRGLREHGRGHWKTIGKRIPTRTTVQVKTHAQVELKKLDNGFNIFEELDEYLKEENEDEEADPNVEGKRKKSSRKTKPCTKHHPSGRQQQLVAEAKKEKSRRVVKRARRCGHLPHQSLRTGAPTRTWLFLNRHIS